MFPQLHVFKDLEAVKVSSYCAVRVITCHCTQISRKTALDVLLHVAWLRQVLIVLLLGSSKHKSEMCKPILWVCHTAFEVSFLHSSEMLKVPRRQEKNVNMNVLLFSILNSGMFM